MNEANTAIILIGCAAIFGIMWGLLVWNNVFVWAIDAVCDALDKAREWYRVQGW